MAVSMSGMVLSHTDIGVRCLRDLTAVNAGPCSEEEFLLLGSLMILIGRHRQKIVLLGALSSNKGMNTSRTRVTLGFYNRLPGSVPQIRSRFQHSLSQCPDDPMSRLGIRKLPRCTVSASI